MRRLGQSVRGCRKAAGGFLGPIDDLPIRTKALAASSVLLFCLVGVGLNAYHALDRSAAGLAHLSNVHIPKQRIASELTGDLFTAHLKIFQFVSWRQVGVSAKTVQATSGEALAQLERLGAGLQRFRTLSHQSPAEARRMAALGEKWAKYVAEMHDVVAAADNDASMASMLLGATDDEFRTIVAELQRMAAQVADQTRATSQGLAALTTDNRDVLALAGAFGALLSALVALFIGRSVVAPIQAVTRTMQAVSSQHERVDIGYRDRKDEIGQMVEAIAQFQETMALQNKLLAARQHELEAQNLRFDTAMNHMSHGLAMFDSEHRLVVSNRLYGELYGLTPAQLKRGTSIRQLLEYRHAKGVFGDVEFEPFARDWLAEFGKASSRVQELADGRVFSIVRRPMRDGGIVSTTEDITERRRSEAKIAHMAHHDALTDLPNRVLLKERLELAVTRVHRGEIVAVHLLDLDHFKNVNDTLGHPVGDKLLKGVTDRLGTLIRETDTIARMGGDEFAIVQVGINQPSDASNLAQRVIDVVSAPHEIEGHQVVAGTSVGIAIGPIDGTDPDQLIRNADLALYRAKGDGRGTFRFFEPDMDARMQARRMMEYDLRKALIAGEFELYYQPLVNLERDEISGCEALLRWRHPRSGMISPGDFIPLAEENGFIVPLGEWVIRQACATAATWPEHVKVAVNLSPAQFKSPGLEQAVVGALAASGLRPERLELEITETVLLQDSTATLATLHQLRSLGVRVAMDDFGTGYSSLSYLQSFPFDKIKIDRSFIKEVADKKNAVDIVRAVAALASGLGMSTTAEGVETKQQLDAVKAEGCTEMQGFVFSEPLSGRDIESLLCSSFSATRCIAGAA
jgi:diguanylate cyclase (GGDEF)-like protein